MFKGALVAAIAVKILFNLGEYTQFLDSISPMQLITVLDNPDGTYTAYFYDNTKENYRSKHESHEANNIRR